MIQQFYLWPNIWKSFIWKTYLEKFIWKTLIWKDTCAPNVHSGTSHYNQDTEAT